MPDRAKRTAPAPRRRRFLEVGAGVLVFIMIVVTTFTTVYLIGVAGDLALAAGRMAALRADVNRLSQLEWEVAADPELLAEVLIHSGRSEAAVREGVSFLMASPELVRVDTEAIRSSVDEYLSALDATMVMYEQGDRLGARELDEQRVDPLFDRVDELLKAQTATIEAEASTARSIVKTEALLLIPLTLIVSGALGFRVTRLAASARSRADFEDMVSGASDMIMTTDQEGTLTYASPSVSTVVGTAPGEGIDGRILDWIHPEDAPIVTAALAGPLSAPGGEADVEVRLRHRGGEWRIVENRVRNISTDPARVRLVWNSRDVTRRRQLEHDLAREAVRDPLTGLANRAALAEEITRSLSTGNRDRLSTSVLMVDLDRFKGVNDSFGHGVGDELLRLAARRLSSTVRSGDFVARHGGDEFVIVVRREPGDEMAAVRIAERIVDEFRAPFAVRGLELFVTTSIGVAVATSDSHADDLVREADTAMYAAKSAGRDGVSMFNVDLQKVAMARLSVEAAVRSALDRDQLVVWYQPEVDLNTGRVVAVEALVRWRQPDGSIWDAGRFVEVAEDIGVIADIDDWVLRAACHWGAVWAEQFPHNRVTVRVNLSARHVSADGLLDTIDDALAVSGLDPQLLCFELTETALVRDVRQVEENLVGMRDRGLRIALDDFGTGYASMAYLSRYPFDVLKIDRSFIASIATSEHDRRLVDGMIALAKKLRLRVTAEGVEDLDQARCLRELGCPGAQGFLFSPAVPATRIGAMLEQSPWIGILDASGVDFGGSPLPDGTEPE